MQGREEFSSGWVERDEERKREWEEEKEEEEEEEEEKELGGKGILEAPQSTPLIYSLPHSLALTPPL